MISVMAETPSNMIPIGSPASDFYLQDTVSGEKKSLSDLKGTKATLIMFICNHCPYVKHVNPELVRLAGEYQAKGIAFVGISPNDAEAYPQDGPAEMKKKAAELGYTFPYLYDKTQQVARAYDAACTPDFYLYDQNLKLIYRGQLDDSRPGNDRPLTGKDLRAAMDAVLSGQPVSDKQYPSVGCNIKWKS